MKIETKFSIGQKVRISEMQCAARILAIYVTIDADGPQYNCRWFIHGELKTGYLLESELEDK